MSYKFSVPKDWNESQLQEYCLKVADGTHDSPKKTEQGKLLVTSKNIIGGTLDLSKSYRISEEDFDDVNRRSKVDKHDVLLSMIGTVGEVCLIKNEPDFAIKNVGLLKNQDPLKAKWLFFYLTSPQAQVQIKERLRGTTQQYLPLGEIRKFPIIYPREPLNNFVMAPVAVNETQSPRQRSFSDHFKWSIFLEAGLSGSQAELKTHCPRQY